MRNPVQFQRGLSLPEFMENYGTESQCIEALKQIRWPNGWRCPICGEEKHCWLEKRRLFQCNKCHYQGSITAQTMFEGTKLSLTKWFLSIYIISTAKNGISSLELARQVGVHQNTAWLIKQKVMQGMMERNQKYSLQGEVEADDAYIGGERTGGKRGRGSENKKPFVAAVSKVDEKPRYMKMTVVGAFSKADLKKWATCSLSGSGTTVRTDGLACFKGIQAAGFSHNVVKHTACGKKAGMDPAFHWVNTILGNVKNSITGTYHAIRGKYISRYLAEFEYRFNRRFDLHAIFKQTLTMMTVTPAMPARLIKLAEGYV